MRPYCRAPCTRPARGLSNAAPCASGWSQEFCLDMREVCPSSSERFSRSARTITISETLHQWTLLRLPLALKGSDTQNNRPPLRVSQALSPGGSCPVSWQCCTFGRFCWATVRFRRAWICVARPNVLPVIRRPRADQPCRGNGVRNLLQYRASIVKQPVW